MELPVPREEIARRLKRLAGQVKGCARMVEQEKDCVDILTQLAAARGALAASAAQVLTNYVHLCLEKEREEGQPAPASLARAFAVWVAGLPDTASPSSLRGGARS